LAVAPEWHRPPVSGFVCHFAKQSIAALIELLIAASAVQASF